jgi:beta-lactamase class A
LKEVLPVRHALWPAALILTLSATAAHAAPRPLTSKEEVLWASLKARLSGIDSRLDGVLGLSLKDLASGATIEIRAQETFPLASSIKLAVLYELFAQAEAGTLDLGEVTRPGTPRVAGDGILQHLGAQVSLTWRDLAVLMMCFSDNEATNLVIDKVGIPRVNARLEALGLRETRLKRRMMDLDAARRGLENVGTPTEMRRLVEVLHAGTGLSPARAQDLSKIVATPKDSSFRVPLPEGLRVMDKPGSLEGVRCVTALVELPGRPYAVSIMTTYLRKDQEGEAAVREISAALYETFDRLARASELGRIISER